MIAKHITEKDWINKKEWDALNLWRTKKEI